MLTLLPQLLFLTPLAITLLRITLGVSLLYTAWTIAEHRARTMRTKIIVVGNMPEWLVWCGAMGLGILSVLLIVGAWTQVAAIIAFFATLKYGISTRYYPGLLSLPASTYYVLAVIALALVATGSGAFAFDLPL